MAKSVIQGLTCAVPNIRLTEMFEENLQRLSRDQEAVVDGNVTLTYEDLNARANLVARSLVRCLHFEDFTNIQGKATCVVGIAMEASVHRLVAMLAVLKAGAAYLPLDVTFPMNRTKYMMENSHACAVIASDEDMLTSFTDTFQGSVQVLDFGTLLSSALSAGESDLNLDENSELRTGKTAYSVAAIFYTSGTTGSPKAVPITHSNILTTLPNVVELVDSSKQIRQANILNFLSIAFPVEVFSSLLYGRVTVIFPEESKRDVSLMIHLLREHRINYILSLTTTLLANVLMVAKVENINPFENVLCVGTGAEIVSPIVIRNFLTVTHSQCKLVVIWGMTETTMFSVTSEYASLKDLEEKTIDGKAPIGEPIPNLNVYIVNDEHEIVPEGEVGQMAVSGLAVAQGYLSKNTDEFISNPLELESLGHRNVFLTGDYGFIKEDQVYFIGRNISRIKVRGYRISATEIDEVVMAVPDVIKAATIAHTVKDDDVIIVTYFTSNKTLSAAEILPHCRQNLPEYAIPRLFQLDEMPLRLPQMKIDYPALHQTFLRHIATGISTDQSGVFSFGNVQKVLANVLCLSDDAIKPDLNFFEIGGNSANAVLVWSQLLQYGYEGTLAEFSSAKTIADLLKQPEDAEDHKYQKFYIQPLNELDAVEQEEVCQFLVTSFFDNRNQLFKQLFPYPLEAYQKYIFSIWPLAKRDSMSYVIRWRGSKKIAAAGFLTTENADDPVHEKGKVPGDALLEQVERPFMDARSSLPGKTVFGSRFATDPELSNYDAATLSQLTYEHSIAVARAHGFARFHVASMIPSLQALMLERGADVWGKVQLRNFEHDGEQPFKMAPDDVYHMSLVLELQKTGGV